MHLGILIGSRESPTISFWRIVEKFLNGAVNILGNGMTDLAAGIKISRCAKNNHISKKCTMTRYCPNVNNDINIMSIVNWEINNTLCPAMMIMGNK